jgi:hypothetical protein
VRAALLGASAGLAAAIAIASAASCSVDHRSGDFTCETTADCTGGRVCDGGFCVQTEPDPPDAPPPGPPDAMRRPDANQCPEPCTSCDVEDKICTVDCAAADGLCTTGSIVCPDGWACDIRCTTQNSCRSGVNCLEARSCKLTCSGESACRGVQCGPGPCDISCTGQNSCRNIACNNSCACGVTCAAQGACADTVTCTSFQCDVGLGCSTLPFGCNTCGPTMN